MGVCAAGAHCVRRARATRAKCAPRRLSAPAAAPEPCSLSVLTPPRAWPERRGPAGVAAAPAGPAARAATACLKHARATSARRAAAHAHAARVCVGPPSASTPGRDSRAPQRTRAARAASPAAVPAMCVGGGVDQPCDSCGARPPGRRAAVPEALPWGAPRGCCTRMCCWRWA